MIFHKEEFETILNFILKRDLRRILQRNNFLGEVVRVALWSVWFTNNPEAMGSVPADLKSTDWLYLRHKNKSCMWSLRQQDDPIMVAIDSVTMMTKYLTKQERFNENSFKMGQQQRFSLFFTNLKLQSDVTAAAKSPKHWSRIFQNN